MYVTCLKGDDCHFHKTFFLLAIIHEDPFH